MAKNRKSAPNRDRYLYSRDEIYYYLRRVPTKLSGLDARGDLIRISLKTSDLATARAIRDVYKAADNELWASMTMDEDPDVSWKRYEMAIKRAKAMGFSYVPAADIAHEHVETILRRIETVSAPKTSIPVVSAAVGAVDEPRVRLSKAFEIYLEKVAPHEILGKSAGQRKRWLVGKNLSVKTFINDIGDLQVDEITRTDARKYYDIWMGRIAPREGKPSHSPSSGNRRIGDIRTLYREYFALLNDRDRANPFDGLSFTDKKKRARRRPPFPLEWILERILKPGSLAGLNEEARGIVLMVAEIGARPSEICNLTPEMIVLNHEVPHLKIEPREDHDDPREIKTESSIRIIPLYGLALEVMSRFPKGFERYKDKEDSLSATLNKYFKENDLLPSAKHTVYSLRHSFEDRMKELRVDVEMRKILMGHSIDRSEYGEGGSLKLRLEEMKKVALPFDPSIV